MSFVPLPYSMRIFFFFFKFRGQHTLSPCNKAIAPLNFFFFLGKLLFFCVRSLLYSLESCFGKGDFLEQTLIKKQGNENCQLQCQAGNQKMTWLLFLGVCLSFLVASPLAVKSAQIRSWSSGCAVKENNINSGTENEPRAASVEVRQK